MRKMLIRLGSSVVLTAALGAGMVHASNARIDTTGPDSRNQILIGDRSSVDVSNRTNVDVSNSNRQTAVTGDAIVSHNTWGGDARSGDASNSNSQSTNIDVSNGGSCCGNWGSGHSGDFSITNTGPDSINRIIVTDRNSVDISNRTDIDVSNSNHQTARSGDAVVFDNTHGGDATSGDARNYNRQSTDVTVTNGGNHGSFADTSSHEHHSRDIDSDHHRKSDDRDDHHRKSDDNDRHNWKSDDNDRHNFKSDKGCRDFDVSRHHDDCQLSSCDFVRHHSDCDDSHHQVGQHRIRPPCHEVVVAPCHRVVPPCHREVEPCEVIRHHHHRVQPCEVKVRPCPVVVHPCQQQECHRQHKHHHNQCHPVVRHCTSRCQWNDCD